MALIREKVTSRLIREELTAGASTPRAVTVTALEELAQIGTIEQLRRSPNVRKAGE